MKNANDTVTVYNRLYDSSTKTESWPKCFVSHCIWEMITIRSVDNSGAARMANTYTVLVDENENYVPAEQWNDLENREGKFTFQTGDFVIFGEAHTELPFAEVKKRYGNLGFTVKSFVDNTAGYKQGRHYEVRGV